jgi:spermidine/putrescine transport system ATP-binding protein
MTMADTIAVMNGGQIEQAGSATELYEHPKTAFVANFLGVSNLIDATVTGDQRVTTHDGTQLHAPECQGLAGEVQIGVRPEKITLVPKGEPVPDGANVLHGKIIVSAFLGISIQYVIQAAGGEELNVFAQNHDSGDAFAVGREVQLAWKPEHTFVVERG